MEDALCFMKGMEKHMTYQEAMQWIEDTKKYGSILGLDNIRALLEKLGNPQEKLQIIHVGGTNGKGSTAAYISTILAAAGYKVGRYISPVIFEYRECIQITKLQEEEIITNYITETEMLNQIELIHSAIQELLKEGKEHPTTFEIETAMSFLHFLEKHCDIVILEVGMGGRLDATNVIENSLCSVLTSISMDHMQFLGNDLGMIAKEKAGILKENGLAICYDYQNEVITDTIRMEAQEKKVTVKYADFSKITSERHSLDGISFSYKNNQHIKLNLLGENQVKNAVLAIEVINGLNESGKLQKKITQNYVYKGLEMTKWNGRFSILSKQPLLIVDGAHNEDAAKSLAKSLELYLPEQKCIFVIGIFADKEYEKVIKVTAPYAQTIITITPDNIRALPSELLRKCAEQYCNHVIDGKNIKEGLDKAWQLSENKTPIITFGSLSFVKDVYRYVKEKHTLC